MLAFSSQTKRFLHKTHRWCGLFLAFFILFYSITGILLNHRKSFDYFITKDISVQQISTIDLAPVQQFISHYKKQINRQDDPKIIRIREGKTIEFLYGSHGKTTYVIDPTTGTMQTVSKNPIQPFHWINTLHKAFNSSNLWVGIADLLSVMLCLATISILTVMKYRPRDYLLLAGGILFCSLGVLFA